MGSKTDIEWADSSINFAMGCDGCELYNPRNKENEKVDHCYAFYLTRRYAGLNGWPESFDTPTLFLHRVAAVERWGDLTGSDRPNKPWLNGEPRHIFHGDMSDYWTESLKENWLLPHIDRLAAMPHTHVFLTKRPRRMAKTFRIYGSVPKNFKLGTSVTNRATLKRAAELVGGLGDMTDRLFLSVEPLVESVGRRGEMSLSRVLRLPFLKSGFQVIVGGESGYDARTFDLGWAEEIKQDCIEHQVAFFMKQTGSNARWQGKRWPVGGKGSALTDIPPHLRVRMMTWAQHFPQMVATR